jgi:phosphoribosylaminoimidazole-succinocarboxamide synthase
VASGNLNIPEAPAIDGASHLHSGKVRDLYQLPDGNLLMVASDRISAFDHVLETTIPDKGEILTRMSLWWFDQLQGLVQNHLVSTDVPDSVRGRAVVCEQLDMYPVECVARGYLTGSVLGEYQLHGEVCGIALPAGLQDGSRLSEPIFTPATKAALGDHDENVDFESVVEQVGDDAAAELRMLTLAVYGKAEEIAREQGIILADTKLEFGRRADHTTVLADEVLTPGDGLRGVHSVYRYRLGGGPTQVINQTMYTNDDASRVYMLFVRCSVTCYEQHKGEIEGVVSSFTVREAR